MLTETRFVRVRPENTCAEVREQLGQAEMTDSYLVVLLDQASKYIGVVPIFQLLNDANANKMVGEFSIAVTPLIGDASVSSVLQLVEWQEYPLLPVIDGQGFLLGTVALQSLLKVETTRNQIQRTDPELQSVNTFFNFFADTLDFILVRRSR